MDPLKNDEPGTAAARPLKTESYDSDSLDSLDIDYDETSLSSTTNDEQEKEEGNIINQLPPTDINAYSSEFALPEMDQCIVRVFKIKNYRDIQIIKENGRKFVLPVPDRLIGKIRVNNFLLIQPTVDGSKHLAEIVRVIDASYKRFYEANNLWPTKYVNPDDLGDLGPVPLKPTKTVKKKPKKKSPKSIAKPAYESTGKQLYEEMKEAERKRREKSDTESDSEDDDITRAEKRVKRLAKIGTHVPQAKIDNTTVTDDVVTSREAIVKPRDEIPLSVGEAQPWEAILQRKHMTEKQIQKHIQKSIQKKVKDTKMRVRRGLQPLDDVDLPCGAVQGQIMVPWEDLVGKYKFNKKDFDDTEDTEE